MLTGDKCAEDPFCKRLNYQGEKLCFECWFKELRTLEIFGEGHRDRGEWIQPSDMVERMNAGTMVDGAR